MAEPAASPSPASPVTVELVGRVAVVRFDDGKANVIGHDAIGAFHAALDQAEAEAGAVAVIGRPGRFSAGFDLSVMTAGMEGVRGLVGAGAELFLRMHLHPQPVVVACTGHALAAGAIILMATDVRIGEAGAFKIGMTEVAIGMPVPVFATELARARLSRRHLEAAIQQATVYDPEGARDAGFLDEVVGPGEAEAVAIARAEHLAGYLRKGAFRQTREHLRGELARRLLADLTADLSTFDVEP